MSILSNVLRHFGYITYAEANVLRPPPPREVKAAQRKAQREAKKVDDRIQHLEALVDALAKRPYWREGEDQPKASDGVVVLEFESGKMILAQAKLVGKEGDGVFQGQYYQLFTMSGERVRARPVRWIALG